MIAKFSTPYVKSLQINILISQQKTEWIKPVKSLNNLGICQYIILYTFLFFMLIIFLR